MTRILLAVGVALLLTNGAWAQSQANCDQIRDAVAKYGYEAARRHALQHYGPEAVKEGDKCLPKPTPSAKHHPKKHQPKKKKPAG
jgi:hypothetical protein